MNVIDDPGRSFSTRDKVQIGVDLTESVQSVNSIECLWMHKAFVWRLMITSGIQSMSISLSALHTVRQLMMSTHSWEIWPRLQAIWFTLFIEHFHLSRHHDLSWSTCICPLTKYSLLLLRFDFFLLTKAHQWDCQSVLAMRHSRTADPPCWIEADWQTRFISRSHPVFSI